MSGEEIKEEQADANRGHVPPGAAEAAAKEIACKLIKNAKRKAKMYTELGESENRSLHVGIELGVLLLLHEMFPSKKDGA